MARWKVSFDPHGSPTGGPVAADTGSELRSRRERHAPSSGRLTCVNAISIASPHPVPGRDPSRFGTKPSGGTRESRSGGPFPRTAGTIAAPISAGGSVEGIASRIRVRAGYRSVRVWISAALYIEVHVAG